MAGRSRGLVVEISAEENTSRAFAQVDAQVAQLRAQVKSLKAELAGGGVGQQLADGMGHAVPQIAAASGAVRELEGILPIRAVERFLSNTLGLGPVLAAAFPIVGAVAFTGVVVDATEKVVRLYQEAENAPKAIERAFDDLTLKLRTENEELDKANAKLAEDIAKLEGKPANGLAAALDDAKLSADRLAAALKDDLDQIDALLNKQGLNVGVFGGAIHNEAPTGEIRQDVHEHGAELLDARIAAANKLQSDLAAANGDDKKIAAAKKDYYDTLDKDFGDYIARYRSQLDNLKKLQQQEATQFRETVGRQILLASLTDGPLPSGPADRSGQVKSLQGAIDAATQLRERIRLTAQNDTLTTKKGALKPPSAAPDNSIAEARKQLADALRRQAEEAANADLAFARQNADLELAQLDDKHKRMLVSDLDYYAQRKKIQQEELDAEDAALRAKQGALGGQIREVITDRGRKGISGADIIRDDAKIVELQTQIAAIDEQRKKLTEERTKIDVDAALQVYELQLKQKQVADDLAAKRDAITGEIAGRLKQSSDKYAETRKGLVANHGEGSQEVSDADFAFSNEQSKIRAAGAEQNSNPVIAGINAQRTAVSDAEARGTTTTVAAQQQRIELDREEAQALGPVLAAYEELANAGDLEATQKVIELKSRIAELNDPVDEVSQHMREQFDSAFESLFENLDQGTKAFQSFFRDIEKELERETYKRYLEPLVQQGLGKVFPNKIPGLPGNGDAGFGGGAHDDLPDAGEASGIGGATIKALKDAAGFSGAGADAKKGGVITIQLINNGDTPLNVGDTSASGGLDKDQVLTIITNDFSSGGIMRALFGGGGGSGSGGGGGSYDSGD